jgi:hypothetical protein
VVLPFIMPPREKTMGWKGRLLRGRWRTLWSATESRYLLTSRDGSMSRFGSFVARSSSFARETTVRSYSALASPVACDPSRENTWMSLRLLVWWPRGSSQTRVPGVEARACPMMFFAPSCRATLLNFLWRQTSG